MASTRRATARLIMVVGIEKLRVELIKKSWAERKEVKKIMLFLQGHNVNTSRATIQDL